MKQNNTLEERYKIKNDPDILDKCTDNIYEMHNSLSGKPESNA